MEPSSKVEPISSHPAPAAVPRAALRIPAVGARRRAPAGHPRAPASAYCRLSRRQAGRHDVGARRAAGPRGASRALLQRRHLSRTFRQPGMGSTRSCRTCRCHRHPCGRAHAARTRRLGLPAGCAGCAGGRCQSRHPHDARVDRDERAGRSRDTARSAHATASATVTICATPTTSALLASIRRLWWTFIATRRVASLSNLGSLASGESQGAG